MDLIDRGHKLHLEHAPFNNLSLDEQNDKSMLLDNILVFMGISKHTTNIALIE